VSLHHLQEFLRRELPKTSRIEGAAGIHDKDGSIRLRHLRLHGGEKSPVEIHLDARFDELPGREAIEVELGLRGDDTRVLAAIAGIELPPISPVEFHGQLHGSEQELSAEGLRLRIGETRLEGNGSGSFLPHRRPAIDFRLSSKDVRLQDLGLVRTPVAPPAPTDTKHPEPSDAPVVDPSHPLPFEQLRKLDLDVTLDAAHVGGYHGLEADDVAFHIQLEDGELVVQQARARYQDGNLEAQMRANARTPIPQVELQLQTTGMNLARVIQQFQPTDYSGLIDAEISLHATGGTLDALRQSLSGNVGLAIRDGNTASRIAHEFVINLARSVFRGLILKEAPTVGCAVTQLEIADGIATVQRLLLKEKEITVTGTGTVDLVRGQYDLLIVPTSENPGIVSVAPEVRVTGPLDDPRFDPIKRTLVTSFGRGLFKNALKAGGLLLTPFLRRDEPIEDQAELCRLSKPEAP
jgi:uncharacterized protein involved in outer membrane biogenesis